MADGKSGNGLAKGVTVCGVVIPMILIAPIVLLMSFSTILVAMVQAQYGTTCGSTTSSSNTTTSWVEWAKLIAADDSHGYSQPRRNGNPDYDCSSLVYYALKQAGLDVGSSAFSTANEGTVLEKAGFERHDWTKVSDLQSGDIVWRSSHTEIYVGDGKFVGAHHDENGGITGPKAGDQTGDEISVDSYAVGYTAYYRYKGAMNVETAGGKVTSAQAVSGKTKDDGWDGMSSAAAKTKWFNGLAGPDDACATYPEGQCTWGACVRAYHLGWKHVGKYWGNGQNWAASARSEGYGTTTDAPVPGAIVSFPAGIEGADATYGHVAVVENVDTAKGTILISEMNVKGPVYSSRTLPIKGGAVYILPKDSISGPVAAASARNSASRETIPLRTRPETRRPWKRRRRSRNAGSRITDGRTASSTVSTNCGRVNPDGGGTRRTRRPARTASRNRCRAARWRPRARIGRPTRPRRSNGDWDTSSNATSRRAARGPIQKRPAGTDPVQKREKRRNTWT